jgi:hypothetical protein
MHQSAVSRQRNLHSFPYAFHANEQNKCIDGDIHHRTQVCFEAGAALVQTGVVAADLGVASWKHPSIWPIKQRAMRKDSSTKATRLLAFGFLNFGFPVECRQFCSCQYLKELHSLTRVSTVRINLLLTQDRIEEQLRYFNWCNWLGPRKLPIGNHHV